MQRIFKRTPAGQKTDLMLKVEARIGRTLEEDFREYYLEKGWGQMRLAHRWGVKRDTIFQSNTRSRMRSWVQMLNLPVRRLQEPTHVSQSTRQKCEVCVDSSVPLERAHFVPARDGGSSLSENIVLLCPNCHTKLDNLGDPDTTERVRAVLLHRTAMRVLGIKGYTPEQFLITCERIINARK